MLAVQSYSRVGLALAWSIERALQRIGYDHADVLLLGYWNHRMRPRSSMRPHAPAAGSRELRRRLVATTVPSRHLSRPAETTTSSTSLQRRAPGRERDCFPRLPAENRPGIVSFTGTSWGQLLNPRYTPDGERTPTASDCYRFVLSHPDVDVCATDRRRPITSSRPSRPRARPDVGGGTGVDEARRRGGSPACLDQTIDTDPELSALQ